jgi:hypothetical protein
MCNNMNHHHQAALANYFQLHKYCGAGNGKERIIRAIIQSRLDRQANALLAS